MNKADLIHLGNRLVKALEVLSRQFHVKSDQHDILLYEAAIIQGKVCFLEKGVMPASHLIDSSLLGDWGTALAKAQHTLSEEVAQFHQAWMTFN